MPQPGVGQQEEDEQGQAKAAEVGDGTDDVPVDQLRPAEGVTKDGASYEAAKAQLRAQVVVGDGADRPQTPGKHGYEDEDGIEKGHRQLGEDEDEGQGGDGAPEGGERGARAEAWEQPEAEDDAGGEQGQVGAGLADVDEGEAAAEDDLQQQDGDAGPEGDLPGGAEDGQGVGQGCGALRRFGPGAKGFEVAQPEERSGDKLAELGQATAWRSGQRREGAGQGDGMADILRVAGDAGGVGVGVEFAHAHEFAPEEEVEDGDGEDEGEEDVGQVEEGVAPGGVVGGVGEEFPGIRVFGLQHGGRPTEVEARDGDGAGQALPEGVLGDLWPHGDEDGDEGGGDPEAKEGVEGGHLEQAAGQPGQLQVAIGEVGEFVGEEDAGRALFLGVLAADLFDQPAGGGGAEGDEGAAEGAEGVDGGGLLADEELGRVQPGLVADFLDLFLHRRLGLAGRLHPPPFGLSFRPVQEVAQRQEDQGRRDQAPPQLREGQQARQPRPHDDQRLQGEEEGGEGGEGEGGEFGGIFH